MKNSYAAIPAIVIIVYLVAEGIKLIRGGIFKKYIPVMAAAVGAVLTVLGYFLIPFFIPASNWIEALAMGIVSGFSATGVNQMFKQMSEGKKE